MLLYINLFYISSIIIISEFVNRGLHKISKGLIFVFNKLVLMKNRSFSYILYMNIKNMNFGGESMKWYFSHKFVMSSFAIALSTTLISSQTHAAEQQLNEKLTNENTKQSDKKPIHSDPTNHTESPRVAGDTVQSDDKTNLYSDNDLGDMPKSEEPSQAQSEQSSDIDSTEQNEPNTDQPSTQDNTDNQPNPDKPDNGDGGDNQPNPDNPSNGNEPNTPSGGGSEVPENPHDEGNTSTPNDDSHGGPSTPNNSENDNTKPSKPNGQEDSNVTLNPGLNTDNSDSNTTNNSMNHTNDNGNEPQYRSSSHHEIASGGASVSYGDLAKSEKSQSNENQLINRFDQMSTGSFKYNPFVVNQVKQLSSGAKTVSDKEISSVLRRQTFADNAFLNELQKGTNYFKFQYFNVLKSSDYYKNLDNQVLALITGEIGSMPDLKNPKRQQSSGKYEYHSSSEDELTHTTDERSKNEIDIKFEHTLFALITAMIIIFVGMVLGYFVNRRNKKDGE